MNTIENEKKNNDLVILLYPEKPPRDTIEKEPISKIMPEDVLLHSLDKNQNLAFFGKNAPVLNGFYTAHINHYPIRIKPDDIWLLIVQAFSNHVNSNSEELRKYFVNFEGKKELVVEYEDIIFINQMQRKHVEDFSKQINEQMKKYLGDEILQVLTPNFSTTTYDSSLICKMSIMGAFKKYFEFTLKLAGCGISYIVLEGEAEDYKKIKSKAEKLSKYKFDWYISRIIPHLDKMIEAKEGKIDNDYFKNIIQKKEVTEIRRRPSGGKYGVKVDHICGWFLHFFAYLNKNGEVKRFIDDSLKVDDFKEIASQLLIVPFKIVEVLNNNKEYLMKYKVGFVGCDQNEYDEVFPVQGWIVSPSTKTERESIL